MRDIPVVPAWAFVHYDHFAWQVALAAGIVEPELAGQPVVLGGRPHERRPVLDCSPEAAARGIFPGQPLREAQARCPEAVFRPLDPDMVAAAFESLLTALAECSPAIEPVGLGRVLIATRGLGALYGGTAGLAARLLAAAGRPAFWDATGAGGIRQSGRVDATTPAGAERTDPKDAAGAGSAGRPKLGGATTPHRDGQSDPAGTSGMTGARRFGPTNAAEETDAAGTADSTVITDAAGLAGAAAAVTRPGGRVLKPATADRTLAAVRRAAPYAPQIGFAEDCFVAEVAAARAEPGSWRVIAPGGEAKFLESLSVRYLPASAETHRRLRLFGLRWIGQVAAISAEDLQAQFGAEGRVLHERSHGRDPRPISPWSPPPEPAERIKFEDEPANWEALERAGAEAVARLAADLQQRGRVAQRVSAALDIEASGTQSDTIEENTPKELTTTLSAPARESVAFRTLARLFAPRVAVFTGTVDLPHPTADTRELERAAARALRRAIEAAGRGQAAPDLERAAATRWLSDVGARQDGRTSVALPPPPPDEDAASGGPLLPRALTVRLAGVGPERGAQLSLFQRSPAMMRATITDLQARWGRDVLKAAAIVAPRARLAARRFAWREIRFDSETPRGRRRRR